MNEQLEFRISQYADGTLDAEQAQALEAQLAQDPQAQAELKKHRRLSEALGQLPMPEVDWNRLASRIHTGVALAPEPGATGDISGPAATQAGGSYRLFARRTMWAAVALAASVMLAAGVAIHMFTGSRAGVSPAVGPVARLMRVRGPHAQGASGRAVTSVSIGPGKGAASASALLDQSASRPARMLVASGGRATDDSAAQLPF